MSATGPVTTAASVPGTTTGPSPTSAPDAGATAHGPAAADGATGSASGVVGRHATHDGRRFYRIAGYDAMPPFFMTVLGASDLWLFISSTGGLTAGRGTADQALFPYTTEDKVTRNAGQTGGRTVLRVAGPAGPVVWQPFLARRPGDPVVERTLLKDELGTTLVFTETRPDLGLTFAVTWQTSGRYGVVRTCELTAADGADHEVEVLDGVVDLLPAGVTRQTQNELSVLLDAYKRAETDGALGVFYLNSTLTDRAEPSESLRATVAWQLGLDAGAVLLSQRQLGAYLAGEPVTTETEVRGEPGAYLVTARVDVPARGGRRWRIVLDTPLDAADVVARRLELTDPALEDRLAADVTATRTELEDLVASSDGAQHTGEEIAGAHHAANVLFNIMRGGVPADGSRIAAADVRAFVALRSPRTAARCAATLDALADTTASGLIEAAETSGDVDLVRLAREYLPLAFSRRHGDPSRPWNTFAIAAHDDQGRLRIDYQGNWRDILQNWEALAWSFPELVESMIQVLLDATTADGYNPYRITRAGIDWEAPEPDNPWANIGYWSDHQIVYLLRLLETSGRFHPGRMARLWDRAIFTHADVPYRIAPYEDIVRDPVNTITFDAAAHAGILARAAVEGADGRLLHVRGVGGGAAGDGIEGGGVEGGGDAAGGPGSHGVPDGAATAGSDGADLVRVTLAEKLLGLLAAKLVNLVPDGGIWMNTQRPEWNDANNALVGRGLSVVTLAQLRRYVVTVRELLAPATVTEELAALLTALEGALGGAADRAASGLDAMGRRAVMDALGTAGSDHRAKVYAGLSGRTVALDVDGTRALLDHALAFVDAGLRANRREDGLYHSYTLLDLGEGTAEIRRLPEMLEGQVAVLGSGLLGPEEALDVLRALRASALYRADQHSYRLYPDRELPRFLERNRVPAERVGSLMRTLLAAGDRSVVVAGPDGEVRFAGGIHNARDVEAALDALPPDLAGTAEERAELLGAFEDVFRHAEFTGRSGSFFGYEGLGSIYWHMVAKLLLATQENLEHAVATRADAEVVAGLRAAYEDVRHGLGYCKPPAVYGAFPADPYSHTPAGKGARQPGMTGQVKEEVLTRVGELGVRVEDGAIVFRPTLLRASEWLAAAGVLRVPDVAGSPVEVALPAGSLGFTFCQVPVVYRYVGAGVPGAGTIGAAAVAVRVILADGSVGASVDRIDAELSAAIFDRTGRVTRVEVDLV